MNRHLESDGVRMDMKPGYKQTEVGVNPRGLGACRHLGARGYVQDWTEWRRPVKNADYVDKWCVRLSIPMQIVDGSFCPHQLCRLCEQTISLTKLPEFRISSGNVVIGRKHSQSKQPPCAFACAGKSVGQQSRTWVLDGSYWAHSQDAQFHPASS